VSRVASELEAAQDFLNTGTAPIVKAVSKAPTSHMTRGGDDTACLTDDMYVYVLVEPNLKTQQSRSKYIYTHVQFSFTCTFYIYI